MSAPTVISVENAHGLFRCTPAALDAAMATRLPSSASALRAYFCARVEARQGEYDDVTSAGELLVMIAEVDGLNADCICITLTSDTHTCAPHYGTPLMFAGTDYARSARNAVGDVRYHAESALRQMADDTDAPNFCVVRNATVSALVESAERLITVAKLDGGRS